MGVLEHTLAQWIESANVTPNNLSPTASARTHLRRAENDVTNKDAADDHETDQFVAGVAIHDGISLSSQVNAMSALLSRPPTPTTGGFRPNTEAEIIVELPDPTMLQHLFDVYFYDFDSYFPIIDRQEFESLVYSIIHRLGYCASNFLVVPGVHDLSTIALVCVMLALAECLDTGDGAHDGDDKPGWRKYTICRYVINQLSHSGPLDLNLVRTQCLAAAYLMHCEALKAASQAVTVAWQLVVSTRLNNQATWPKGEPEETLQRQQLWWTIYYLDRQISRRSGLAYHIRDTEFVVDDFSESDEAVDSGPTANSAQFSNVAKSYMQGLINLARLWGNVWDMFFAVGATKPGDWMEIEIMDARILNTRRQLPNTLNWDKDDLPKYTLNGEDEPHIRRRLQLYTVSGA